MLELLPVRGIAPMLGLAVALVAGLAIIAAVLVLFSVALIERGQARTLAGLLPPAVAPDTQARVAVVYFSRSGNTALAARYLARRFQAALFPLAVPADTQEHAYPLGMLGLANALRDACRLKKVSASLPENRPTTVDLSAFDTVWLGSPVWLYSPAPPIWRFVELNRFDDQHVVLFNTYNSHIAEESVARLEALVMARGARSFAHRKVLRGRMTRQLSPAHMLEVIEEDWFSTDTGGVTH